MARPLWLTQAIAAGRPFHHKKKTPWVHNLINLSALSLCILGLVGTLWLSTQGPWWLTVLPCAILQGVWVLAAGSLLFHEASHNMCWLSKRADTQRRMNHWTGQAASLVFNTDFPSFWEQGHLQHHKDPLVAEDPMLPGSVGGAALGKTLLKIVLIPGYALIRNSKRTFAPTDPRMAGLILAWGLIILGCVRWLTWQAAATWVVGMALIDILVLLRQSQEHPLGTDGEAEPYLRGRTSIGWLQRIIAPLNQHLHFEHHLNFGVPWYSLPAYHKKVIEIVPRELHPYYYREGLGGFWEQLKGEAPMPPAQMD